MLIRKLTDISELPKIIDGAKEFYDISRIPGDLNADLFLSNMASLIEGGNGVLIVAEEEGKIVAGIGGVVHKSIYSGENWLTEIFWYAMPSHRDGTGIKLLRAFEKEAQERECKVIMMAYLFDSMPEKVKRVYQLFKYSPMEEWWYKSLR